MERPPCSKKERTKESSNLFYFTRAREHVNASNIFQTTFHTLFLLPPFYIGFT